MKLGVIIVLMGFAGALKAQQLPVYSAFQHNPYLINPAVTGYDHYMDITAHAKKQWLGLDGGPFNQNLTIHSSINEMNIGVGGGVFNDQLGVLRQSGFLTSFAYHLPVGEEAKLGFGATGRFAFNRLNHSAIQVKDQGDLLLTSANRSGLVPDVSFGLLLHRYDYLIGMSVQNVIGTSVDFGGVGFRDIRHYNLFASWKTAISDDFGLTPAFYGSYINGFPFYGDLRLSMDYQQKFDFELGVKTTLDLVIGFGMEVIENLRFNYNYDLITTGIGGSSGSHELVVSYDFYYNPAYKKSKPRYKWIRKAP